jgi:hypothetical protein
MFSAAPSAPDMKRDSQSMNLNTRLWVSDTQTRLLGECLPGEIGDAIGVLRRQLGNPNADRLRIAEYLGDLERFRIAEQQREALIQTWLLTTG